MAKRAIQVHHIRYEEPQITVSIYKGEHEILSKLGWYCKNNVSKGFIKALRFWLKENAKRAKEINNERN